MIYLSHRIGQARWIQLFFDQKNSGKVKNIPILQIVPNKAQPRIKFTQEDLESLKDSIRENGILQPLTVRKVSGAGYELIAGERRLRASKLLGLEEVPCILIECSDEQSAIFALIENLQRSDLNPFEEAEGIQKLIEKQGITQSIAAKKLGKKQSTVANKLRLLVLNHDERAKITNAGLTERHARALIKLKESKDREIALDKIIKNSLNVQQTEELIDKILHEDQVKLNMPSAHRTIIIKDVRIFINTIDKAIHTMRNAGIDAIAEQVESEQFLEYTVKIPKKSAIKKLA